MRTGPSYHLKNAAAFKSFDLKAAAFFVIPWDHNVSS